MPIKIYLVVTKFFYNISFAIRALTCILFASPAAASQGLVRFYAAMNNELA